MRQKVNNKNHMKGFKLSGGFVPTIAPEFIFFLKTPTGGAAKNEYRWRPRRSSAAGKIK